MVFDLCPQKSSLHLSCTWPQLKSFKKLQDLNLLFEIVIPSDKGTFKISIVRLSYIMEIHNPPFFSRIHRLLGGISNSGMEAHMPVDDGLLGSPDYGAFEGFPGTLSERVQCPDNSDISGSRKKQRRNAIVQLSQEQMKSDVGPPTSILLQLPEPIERNELSFESQGRCLSSTSFNENYNDLPCHRIETDSVPPDTTTIQSTTFPEASSPDDENQQHIPYADGEPHVFYHDNNYTGHLGITLTSNLVSLIRSIGKESRALEQQETLLEEAKLDISGATFSITSCRNYLETLTDEAAILRSQDEIAKYERRLERASNDKAALEQTVFDIRLRERLARTQTQNLFEQVLDNAGLLDIPSLEPPAIHRQRVCGFGIEPELEIASEYSPSPSSTCHDSLSSKTLTHQSAREELLSAHYALVTAEGDFDFRHHHYEQEKAVYQEAVTAGQTSMTQSEFDVCMLEDHQARTRAFIEAEERYKFALQHVKALGLPENEWEDFGYDDEERMGYRESAELSAINALDRERVERWRERVRISAWESGDVEVEIVEDESSKQWDPKAMELWDSCSAVDDGGYKPEILDWEESCRKVRAQLVGKCEGEN